MVENNSYNSRWLTPCNCTILVDSPIERGSRNNGPPQHSYKKKTKSRTISVLQNKLYFMSSIFWSRSSLMETLPLFLILLLSLSNSFVSSDPAPQPIMSFPSETRVEQRDSTYSLFPDEDLRTGKKIRFQDEQSLNRGRPIPLMSHQYHSYNRDFIGDRGEDRFRRPIMFEDRTHRPQSYDSASRFDRADPFRSRGSRVYFDDEIVRDRYREKGRFHDQYPHNNYYDDRDRRPYYDRREQQPSLLDRPLSPVRPYNYYPSNIPVPGPSHSKLPVGDRIRGGDVRIHVFDPDSNSFGNPRNSGQGTNFVPSPELFLNHDQYLEYYRKIALVRDQEFKKLQALGSTPSTNQETSSFPTTKLPDLVDPKRLLFTAQQPFDISELFDSTTTASPKGPITQGPSPFSEKNYESTNDHRELHSKDGEVAVAIYTGNSGEIAVGGVNKNSHSDTRNSQFVDGNEQKNDNVEIASIKPKNDVYGGESEKDVQEGENSKTQLIQILPEKLKPSFISKSGRRLAYDQIQRQDQSQFKHRNTTEEQEHGGYPRISPLTARQPLISSFSGFGEDSEVLTQRPTNINDRKDDGDTKNHKMTTTTAKSINISIPIVTLQTVEHNQDDIPATALSLIEIPSEADGFIQIPQFVTSTETKRSKNHRLLYNYQREMESRPRIRTNSTDKIATMKMKQELKQRQNKKNKKSKTELYNQHEMVFNSPNTPLTSSLHSFENNATTNLRIPLNSKPKALLLNANVGFDHEMFQRLHQRHSFLDNNDLVDPGVVKYLSNNGHPANNYEEERHFTLINQNNDHVDILDHQDERLTPLNLIVTSNYKTVVTSSPNHRQADVDLPKHTGDKDTKDLTRNDDTHNRNDAKTPYSNDNPFSSASNFIKVVRIPNVKKSPYNSPSVLASANQNSLPTAAKTKSMFMVQKMDPTAIVDKSASRQARVLLSSLTNSPTLSLLKSKSKNLLTIKKLDNFAESQSTTSSSKMEPLPISNTHEVKNVNNSTGLDKGIGIVALQNEGPHENQKMEMSMTSSASFGVIKKVHAHISHCPKLHSPAEIICDIHIRERHGHPNPQLTVGWRRKFYNSTQPDILIVSNMTQVYKEIIMEQPSSPSTQFNNEQYNNGTVAATTIRDGEGNAKKSRDSGEDFHDKFNVTLAPGISPMLRSVLLIKSVTGPDCGNYLCQVTDGIYTLSSETLLFLCH